MSNNCRICGIAALEDSKRGNTKLLHCKYCDIYYLKDFPKDEKLNDYYSSNYQLHSGSGNEIEDEHRRIFRITEQIHLISQIKEFNPGRNLLDIGCDKGFFLDEARRWGFEVTGVEPMVSNSEYGRNLGIHIVNSMDKLESKFDVVTMWHSLEHFPNPKDALKNIHDYMNASSLIFIRVPAFDSIWSKLLGAKWIWFQPENHYFHYTNQSLGKLLNESGFQLERIAIQYANNRFTKKMNNLLNSFFRYAFDRKIPLKKRFSRIYQDVTGMELFAIARKNNF